MAVLPPVYFRKTNGLELQLATFKTPIGYLRYGQVLLCAACIVLVSCWGLELFYNCPGKEKLEMRSQFFRTFRLSTVKFMGCDDKERSLWHANDDAPSNAGFFYFVSAFGLLYSVITGIAYTFCWNLYISNEAYVLLDLLVTFVLTIFFLIGSCVWWSGAHILMTATSDETISTLLSENAGFWSLSEENLTFEKISSNWVLPVSVVCFFALTIAYFFSLMYIAKGLLKKISNEYEPGIFQV